MAKSGLITVLALIATVSAKPYVYSYGTLPYAQRAAYTAAELYNPATPLTAAYPAGYPAAYSAGYPTAYSTGYPTAYSAIYSGYPGAYTAPLSGAYSAALPYSGEELAALYNPVSPLGPVAPVAPVAPLSYAAPYSYLYKR